jgi:DNA polymerase-3 subunit epsilon
LLDFLEDSPLVAHNASFDFGFLNFELERCGKPHVCMSRMVDTLTLARSKHPGAKHSLDALCVRFGIDRSHRVKHGALLDAQLLAQVYVELTGGRQIGLGLVADTASVEVRQSAGPVTIREPRPARPHAPAAEELERHRAFIAQLVNPLWARFAGAG